MARFAGCPAGDRLPTDDIRGIAERGSAVRGEMPTRRERARTTLADADADSALPACGSDRMRSVESCPSYQAYKGSLAKPRGWFLLVPPRLARSLSLCIASREVTPPVIQHGVSAVPELRDASLKRQGRSVVEETALRIEPSPDMDEVRGFDPGNVS